MTVEEIDNHDKIQAEIAKLIAETALLNRQTHAGAQIAEADKYRAETAKIYKDLKWHEIILLISGTLAFSAFVVALTKAFL
jgi:hypothetical protein